MRRPIIGRQRDGLAEEVYLNLSSLESCNARVTNSCNPWATKSGRSGIDARSTGDYHGRLPDGNLRHRQSGRRANRSLSTTISGFLTG
jgi:hypothetical protein